MTSQARIVAVLPLADRDAIRRHVAIGAALLEAIEAMQTVSGREQQVDVAARTLITELLESGYEIIGKNWEATR